MRLTPLVILTATTLIFSQANAAWQPTDGTLDYTCTDGKRTIDFTAFYDDATGGDSFDDVQLAYKLEIQQFAFRGSEENPVVQEVPGCEFAPLMLEYRENGVEIYYECAADGDAGYGTIDVDFTSFSVQAEVNFPEGQATLIRPIPDGTTYNLSCNSKY